MEQNKASDSAKIEPPDPSLKTVGQQRRLANLRPFKKGQSGNPGGRPKSFDQARALAQEILHRELETKTKDGRTISVVEAILMSWAKTKEHQKSLIELAFGKVPDKLETIIEDSRTLKLHWPHERKDLAHTNGSTNRSN